MSIELWNLKNSGYSYYYDISSFIDAIRRGEFQYDFSFKDSYVCGEEVSNPLEQSALQEKNNIIYTDEKHPICLGIFESFINRSFFERHKDIIVKEIRKKMVSELPYNFIIINKYLLSTDLLRQLIKKYNGQRFIFKDVILNDEQINLLRKNHIYADQIIGGIKKNICTNLAYNFYTFDDLEKSINIVVDSQIKEEEIDNFKGIDNLIITIDNVEDYEDDYFKKVTKILSRFDSLNTKLTIRIKCNRRSFLNKYIDLINLSNITLLINNDFYDYPLSEYKDEEALLNSMVKNINNGGLTPFEKYVAVYNIVKNYKPYKEVDEEENFSLSRDMRYILKNDYMVCVGYSKLLRELLDKVGIESFVYFTSIDTSYDDGFTLEDKPLELCRHARVVVKLTDSEYDINGIYISDPTWDNNINIDKYSNMIMPFDYMQKSRSLFKLEDVDYILDVHSLEEFYYKVNLLLGKKISLKFDKFLNKGYQEITMDSCYEIIYLITNTIKGIDYEKYNEINEIWDYIFKENNFESFMNYYDFFIKYIGAYIVSRTNKEIGKNTIIRGIVSSKIKTYKLSCEEINDYIEVLSNEFDKQVFFDRPYAFPDNYLSEDDDGVYIKKKIL